MVLGLFFVLIGILGLIVGDSVRPVSPSVLGPSRLSWGESGAAVFIAIGVSAGWFGWCLWFPDGRKRSGNRKSSDKGRSRDPRT